MAFFVKLVDKQQGRALKYELAPQLQARHHSVSYLKRLPKQVEQATSSNIQHLHPAVQTLCRILR